MTSTVAGARRSAAGPVHAGGRNPSIDGLRGIAVLLVLLFHLRLGPFGGGFVGVGIFFTLSGFLIASRTLTEVAGTGRWSIGGFIERRIRRLAPASLLCVAGTVVATHLWGSDLQAANVRGDAIAAVANVANWRFLARGTSYADLFAGPSPLNHYWSLAIEEQFYVAFPLAVAALLVLSRRHRLRLAAVATVVGAAGSLALAWIVDPGDRFYYGTDTRMFELLAGVGLALAIRRWGSGLDGPRRQLLRWASIASALALVLLVVSGMVFDNGSPAFAHGGAQAVALLTVVCLWGLLDHRTVVARMCGWRPLVWIGTISYGIYLFHWPIVALTPSHVGPLEGTSLSLVQLAASIGVAALSFHLLERRVTGRRLLRERRTLVASWGTAMAAVIALALVIPTPDGAQSNPMLASGGMGLRPVPTSAPGAPPPTDAVPTAAGPAPLRVAIAGDSTASVIAAAVGRYAARNPTELQSLDLSMAGCTITRVATIRHYRGESGQDMSGCALWPLAIPPRVQAFRPDISVVFVAMMEQADQRATPHGEWHNVLDPAWADHQRADLELLATALHETGAPSFWADVPYMKFQANLPWLSDDPARTDALNGVLRKIDADRPDVALLPYADRLNEPGHRVDTRVRPDGIHLSDAAADDLVEHWLVPRLEAWRTAATTSAASTPTSTTTATTTTEGAP